MSVLNPENVTVLVDNREQLPWNLTPLAMAKASLQTGDYALEADPGACVIERKGLADLLGCLGNGRKRFENELLRLKAYPAKCVVVESTYQAFLENDRSQVSRASRAGSVAAWTARFAAFQFCDNREMAEDFARRFLFAEARRIWQKSEKFRQNLGGKSQ